LDSTVSSKNATNDDNIERVGRGRNGTQLGSRIHSKPGGALYTLAHGVQQNTGDNPTEVMFFAINPKKSLSVEATVLAAVTRKPSELNELKLILFKTTKPNKN